LPQLPASAFQVFEPAEQPSRPGEIDGQAIAPFPGASIAVYALHLEPLRVAGLQALFAQHAGLHIIDGTRGESGQGWRDPSVKVALVGAQSGPSSTLSLIASIRSTRPNLPVIVMSPATGDEAILAALNLGVKGFLHETVTGEQFEEAVRTVASGSIWAPRRLLARFIDRILAERDAQSAPEAQRFTARERQVMDLLLEGQPNREIASRLRIEERTVKVYVARLMRKMGVRNRTALSMRAMSTHRS
jgi:DNA-binding NarL/FixJ family response regulator